jgi:hypothetical protein
VTHWQEVQQLQENVSTTKLQLLMDQQAHGNRLLEMQTQQVGCRLGCDSSRVSELDHVLAVSNLPLSTLQQLRAFCDRLGLPSCAGQQRYTGRLLLSPDITKICNYERALRHGCMKTSAVLSCAF